MPLVHFVNEASFNRIAASRPAAIPHILETVSVNFPPTVPRPIARTLTIGIFVVVKLSFFIKIQRNLALIRGEIKKWEAGFPTGDA